MKLRITERSMLEQKRLEITSAGVECFEASVRGRKRTYQFGEIDVILFDAVNNKLSLQVGGELFIIKALPGNAQHNQVINALVHSVRAAQV